MDTVLVAVVLVVTGAALLAKRQAVVVLPNHLSKSLAEPHTQSRLGVAALVVVTQSTGELAAIPYSLQSHLQEAAAAPGMGVPV